MIPLRALPNGKPISILGFGCSSIWAKAQFPADRAAAILAAAEEAGINHFDTSPSYGWGEAERRLGAFLAERDSARLVISTKGGTFLDTNGRMAKDFSPEALERSLGESLKRLDLEQVDIFYLHGAYVHTFNDEVYRFFEREKTRGRIVQSGVNSFDPAIIEAFSESPLDVIMLQLNVADLSVLPILDRLKALGKTVIAGTILAQGITRPATFLPRSWRELWYLARALKNDPAFIIRGQRLAAILKRHGLTEPADPLRFVTSDPRITSGLFGTSKVNHVLANAVAATKGLDQETRESLLRALDNTGRVFASTR